MDLNDFWNKIRILIHIGQFNMMFYVHKERWIKLKDQTFYLWSLRWLLSWRHVIFSFVCCPTSDADLATLLKVFVTHEAAAAYADLVYAEIWSF